MPRGLKKKTMAATITAQSLPPKQQNKNNRRYQTLLRHIHGTTEKISQAMEYAWMGRNVLVQLEEQEENPFKSRSAKTTTTTTTTTTIIARCVGDAYYHQHSSKSSSSMNTVGGSWKIKVEYYDPTTRRFESNNLHTVLCASCQPYVPKPGDVIDAQAKLDTAAAAVEEHNDDDKNDNKDDKGPMMLQQQHHPADDDEVLIVEDEEEEEEEDAVEKKQVGQKRKSSITAMPPPTTPKRKRFFRHMVTPPPLPSPGVGTPDTTTNHNYDDDNERKPSALRSSIMSSSFRYQKRRGCFGLGPKVPNYSSIGGGKVKTRKNRTSTTINESAEQTSKAAASTTVTSTTTTATTVNATTAIVPFAAGAASASGSFSSPTSMRQRYYDRAMMALTKLPHVWPHECQEAVEAVGYPYSLQEIMEYMQIARRKREESGQEWSNKLYNNDDSFVNGKFTPVAGLQIRKMFGGRYFVGKVMDSTPHRARSSTTNQMVNVWKIQYEDNDTEDLELDEILRTRIGRPRIPVPCRGRAFQMLELFCGRGIVTQAFLKREWRVQSIDSDPNSNATLKKSILEIDPAVDLDFVPDFIWASPPCHTYSNLAGGVHRKGSAGEYGKSQEALAHDYIFVKLMEIVQWVKHRHPHVIVVIENPVGALRFMPLLKELEHKLPLMRTKVDYCTFGRDEKKPTMLWTNDHNLRSRLTMYNCSERCPYGQAGEAHPVDLRRTANEFDYSSIPEALAEEVAEYSNAKFFLDNLRQTKAVEPGEPTKK